MRTSESLDEKYMRMAIAKARTGIGRGQTPFGACIVRAGRVLACEHNQVWKRTDITAHAEVMALRSAGRKTKSLDFSGAVMYSTCEPCPMCLTACHWARISRIVFGAGIADARRHGFHELVISNHEMIRRGKSRMVIRGGVLAAESRALFEQWAGLKNSRPY